MVLHLIGVKMNKNVLALAYLGDAIYEVYVRKYLIDNKIVKVKELQAESIKYVSASNQAKYLKELIEKELLSEEELQIVITARNHKNNHKPKNCDIITYKYATGLEALIGYLYFKNNKDRLEEIMSYILKGV